MLIIPPGPYRKRPARRKKSPAPAIQPLNLVAADYQGTGTLTLVFDRAVNLDAVAVNEFIVRDGTFMLSEFVGSGTPVLVSANTVELSLLMFAPYEGEQIHLAVGAANGIVAEDDAAPWPGTNDLLLPWP